MSTREAAGEAETVYVELIGFLNATRPDVQQAAVDAVLSVLHSHDESEIAKLVRHGAIKPLCKLASRPAEVGLGALECLVNLSSSGMTVGQCVEDMVDSGATNRMSEIALTSPPPPSDDEEMHLWRKRINFALAILANITRNERGAVEFCGKSMPEEAVLADKDGSSSTVSGNAEEQMRKPEKPTLNLLLSRFLLPTLIKKTTNNNDTDQNKQHKKEAISCDDPYQHFAAVLMNATQIEQGRKFVMRLHRKKKKDDNNNSPSTSVLQTILPQLNSPNDVRRRGIAGAVKNCCFDKDSAFWLLNEVGIVKALLYPLAGPEELDPDDKIGLDPDLWLEGPDKVREPDEYARMCLVEAILLLLASGRRSREFIRAQKTYVILKIADMGEESEAVSASINECVQYLRRDEEGEEEGASDKHVEAVTRGQREILALPAPAPSVAIRPLSEDFDDVD